MNEKEQKETKAEEERIRENGQVTLEENGKRIHLLSIIGEIEGHDNLSGSTKTTKYEHILPELAKVEIDEKIGGVLILVNTIGGNVSCGLALAEMIASLSKPTVSLVIGDSHSIGVPLAVASDYSFIVPTGTMLVHPVRMSGMVIGTAQTYEYFEMIEERIISFVSEHSRIDREKLKRLMHNTKMLTKDLGTVLVGKEAVECGLIDGEGGIRDAIEKLNALIKRPENMFDLYLRLHFWHFFVYYILGYLPRKVKGESTCLEPENKKKRQNNHRRLQDQKPHQRQRRNLHRRLKIRQQGQGRELPKREEKRNRSMRKIPDSDSLRQ